MQRSTLAELATIGHSLEVITTYEEWSAMVDQSQQTLERIASAEN